MKENIIESRKSVKEGGLEEGIAKLRQELTILEDMIDQIEALQRVPHGYENIGDKVDSRHLPALDQFADQLEEYNAMQKETEKSLNAVYKNLMNQLSMLTDLTGVSGKEEILKFDKDTGRQEKDNQ